jgi:TPR repeat protein
MCRASNSPKEPADETFPLTLPHRAASGSPLCSLLSFAALSSAALAAGDQPTEAEAERLLALRREALALEHGEGVPKDAARAARLYCDGARAGDAEAQFNLGWMYANGRGIERDDARAAYFFNLAAKQGHPQSRNMLRLLGEPTAEVARVHAPAAAACRRGAGCAPAAEQ